MQKICRGCLFLSDALSPHDVDQISRSSQGAGNPRFPVRMQVADGAPSRPCHVLIVIDHGADEAETLGSSQPHALQIESHHPGPALAAILEEPKTPEPQRQSPCRDRHRDSKNKRFHPTPEEKEITPGKTTI
jgi:hypothetical protein